MSLSLGLGLGLTMQRGGTPAPFAIADQALAFGALTLEGAGGIKPVTSGTPAGAYQISGSQSANYSVDASGFITPASDGAATDGDSFTYGDGTTSATITIAAEADTYSFKNATELAAIIAVGVSTVSGKTMKGRPGNYTWTDATLNNRAFTSETTITSHDTDHPVTWKLMGDNRLAAPTNLTLSAMKFVGTFTPGASDQTKSLINVTGDIDGFRFTSNVVETNLLALADQGYKPVDNCFRCILSGVAATDIIKAGGYYIEDNVLSGVERTMNLPGGTGPLHILRNEIKDFAVDGMYVTGNQSDFKFNDNTVWRPLAVASKIYSVASIDVDTDYITLTEAHDFGDAGSTITFNFVTGTEQVPGGAAIMVDYHATVIDETTIHATDIDLTSQGSGVLLWEEPPHADGLQVAAGIDHVFVGEIKRNIFAAIRDDDRVFVDEFQIIFMEDNNSFQLPDKTYIHPDTTHYNVDISGNIAYARTNYAAFVANAYNTWIYGNTFVAPSDATASLLPYLDFADHFDGTRAGNVARDNIVKAVTRVTPYSGGLVTNNVTAYPDALDSGSTEKYSDVFVNPEVPTTPAELLTMYAIKSGGPADTADPKAGSVGTGYFDYDAHTSDHPSAPSDITGPSLSSVSGTESGSTSASLTATTDTGDGTIYFVVSESATRPSPDQMVAGQDSGGSAAPYSTSSTVTTTGAQTASAIGLIAETAYYVHALHVDANGNYSVTTASEAAFTTPDAPDAYSDEFATDTSANYTANGGGTITYDAANQQLDFTQAASYDGIISPAITVISGQSYTVTVNATNRSTVSQMDIMIGTTPGGSQLGVLPSGSRLQVVGGGTSSGDMSMTVTASGTTMYVIARCRGGGSEQFSLNSIIVQ